MSDKYTFKHWVEHHGYSHGSGDYVEVSKQAVWDAIKGDKDFFKMKIYRIKVEVCNQNYYPQSYAPKWYETSNYWAETLAEAKKIGEVEAQVYPEAVDYRKQTKVRANAKPVVSKPNELRKKLL